MKRRTLLVVCFTLVVTVLPATAGSISDAREEQPQAVTVNTSLDAPGAQLASTVTVEGIDVRNEHHRRVLAIGLRRATTPDDRAAIVATTVREADDDLDTLETELRRLETAHRAGRVSNDRYEAERTVITAEAEGIGRVLGRLRPLAAQLPTREFDDRTGIVVTIDRLNERASALVTGEIAASPAEDASEPVPEAGTRSDDNGSPAPSSGERSPSGTVTEAERPPSDAGTDDNSADAPAGSATERITTNSTDDGSASNGDDDSGDDEEEQDDDDGNDDRDDGDGGSD